MMRLLICGVAITVTSFAVSAELPAQVRRKIPVRNIPGRKTAKPTPKALAGSFEKQLEAERKEEAKRLNRDLAYWNRILSGKPTAEERQKALFHVGVVSLQAGRWEAADRAFETLIKDDPKNPWAMPSRCRRIRIKLEYTLDLDGANKEMAECITWARTLDAKYFPRPKPQPKKSEKTVKAKTDEKEPAKSPDKPKPEPKPKFDKKATPSLVYPVPTEKQQLQAVYRQGGVVNGIQGKLFTTKTYLLKAQVLHGPIVERQSPDDIAEQVLLSGAVTRRGMVSLELWKSKKDLFPYVCYAIHLLNSRDFERPRDYIALLLRTRTLEFTDFQKSYLHFLRGQSYNGRREKKERQKAAAEFVTSQKLAPKAFWSDQALFLAGNAAWNHSHDAKQAIRHWEKLQRDYPRSREADRSAYYVGVVYQQTKQYKDAKKAFETFLKERPESAFVKLTKDHLKKVNSELSRPGVR